MRRMILLLIAVGVSISGRAQEILQRFDWSNLANGVVLMGTVEEQGFLRVESTNSTGLLAPLLRIETPRISGTYYAVRGQIRYEGVDGDGFLEMWNVFPPTHAGGAEGRFFSRTRSESGEMGKISGTSPLRTFLLPFNRTGDGKAPSRLELNLILPKTGVAHLGPLELVEYAGNSSAMAVAGAWWSDRTAGWIGGVGGTLMGCLAGLMVF